MFRNPRVFAVFVFTLAAPLAPAAAAITTEGDTFLSNDPSLGPVGQTVIGDFTDGSLTVTPPDTFVTQSLVVAQREGSTGLVDVAGGALTVNGNSEIGAAGVGELLVRDGGSFSQISGQALVGASVYGRLTVTGPGSRAEFASPFDSARLSVGGPGFFGGGALPRGEVRVDNGGELSTGQSTFGSSSFDGTGSAAAVVTGAGSRWFYADDTIFSNATLAVAEGAQLLRVTNNFDNSPLVFNDGSTASITGSGSYVGAKEVRIAELGQAVVRVDGGADVNAEATFLGGIASGGFGSTPRGRLELDGLGTTWTTAGLSLARQGGHAEVSISGGAVMHAGSLFGSGISIATDSDSSAEVTIDGPASRLISNGSPRGGRLEVGGNGRGALTIRNAAYHQSGEAFVGNGSDLSFGEVLVTGAGSRWMVNDSLQIVRGSLTISDGAVVEMPFGPRVTAAGSINLEGGRLLAFSPRNTTIENNGLIAGDGVIEPSIFNGDFGGGRGVVRVGPGERLEVSRIDNQGLVEVNGGELLVDTFEVVSGEVDIDGGLIQFETIDIDGQLNLRNATLRNDPAVASNFGILVDAPGEVRFLGGDNLVDAEVLNRDGRIVVTGGSEVVFNEAVNTNEFFSVASDSSATFYDEFVGEPIFGGGGVRFEDLVRLSPLAEDGFDAEIQLTPTASLELSLADFSEGSPAGGAFLNDGATDLAGELVFANVADLLTPGVHDVTVVEAASLTGEFDFLPEVGSFVGPLTRFLGIDYTATEAIVTLEQLAPGDANGDGLVDAADLEVWAGAHGAAALNLADANGDGLVNAADYTAIRDAMTPPPNNPPIPEPTTAALTAVAAITYARRRRGARPELLERNGPATTG